MQRGHERLRRDCSGFQRLAAAVLIAGSAAGCNIGPDSIEQDRVDYGEALARSGREELLRNIVRLRYLESPMFLAVNSLVSQYAFEGSVNAGAGWGFGGTNSNGTSAIGATGSYADRPTITYAPLSGQRFAVAYLRPIPEDAVLALLQSGYRVDFMFPLLVASINKYRNGFHAGRRNVPTDPSYVRCVELLTEMQEYGEFFIRAEGPDSSVVDGVRSYLVLDPNTDAAGNRRADELRKLLDVPDGTMKIEIVPGSGRRPGATISIATRSLLMILGNLASQIDVPAADIERGAVRRCVVETWDQQDKVRVLHGATEPVGAYVAIQHRGVWFWIDECDVDSKEVFLALLILTSLADTGSGSGGPVLTIPTG